MSLFKINRGNSAGLPTTMTDGWAYFCTDTSEFFIDYTDTNGILCRKQLNSNEAKKIIGYDVAKILNNSDIEIPTSKAVCEKIDTVFTSPKFYTQVNSQLCDTEVLAHIYSGENIFIGGSGTFLTDEGVSVSIETGQTYMLSVNGANYKAIASNNMITFESAFNNTPLLIGLNSGRLWLYSSSQGGKTINNLSLYKIKNVLNSSEFADAVNTNLCNLGFMELVCEASNVFVEASGTFLTGEGYEILPNKKYALVIDEYTRIFMSLTKNTYTATVGENQLATFTGGIMVGNYSGTTRVWLYCDVLIGSTINNLKLYKLNI